MSKDNIVLILSIVGIITVLAFAAVYILLLTYFKAFNKDVS